MTYRLVAAAKHNWPTFDGICASQGFDPLELPWDRFLNLIHWFLTRNAGEAKDIEDWERHLWMPPVGVEAPAGTPWSVESQESAMSSFGKEFQNMGSDKSE